MNYKIQKQKKLVLPLFAVNQLTGVYMIATFAFKELIIMIINMRLVFGTNT